MERRYTILAAAVLAIAGVAAWGPLPGEADAQSQDGQTHHVHIEDFDMEPSSLTIDVGDTVEWHNHDSATHTATDDDGAWGTGSLANGQGEQITFEKARDDTYHCEFHPNTMTGFELVVDDPPSVAIDTPSEGDTLSGEVTVEGTAEDPEGELDAVEVRVDGGDWQEVDGSSSWSFAWETRSVADGEHTVEARAVDALDQVALDAVTVQVSNPSMDLQVEDLTVDEGLPETEVEATLANGGDGPTPPTTLALRYEAANNEDLIAEVAIGELAPGASHTVATSWDTSDKVGEVTVVALADADDGAAEVDESNNEARQAACLPPVEGATCAVPGVDAGAYTP